jgi:hypothetical protein
MTLNNFLLILMGLFYTVAPIAYREYFLVLAFMIYGLCFGYTEYVASFYTGSTISMQMWALVKLHQWKGIIICSNMVLATICLVLHLMGVGRNIYLWGGHK